MKKILKFIIGILLFLIAYLLFIPLLLINLLVKMIKGYNFTDYFKDTALSIDILGNSEFEVTWNFLLRKSNGYKFGFKGETISSALGKNQRINKLSILGKLLCTILDWIDKDHCKNSINDEIEKEA